MTAIISDDLRNDFSASTPDGFLPCMQTVLSMARLLTQLAIYEWDDDPENHLQSKPLDPDDLVELEINVFADLQRCFFCYCDAECDYSSFTVEPRVSDLMIIWCIVITRSLPGYIRNRAKEIIDANMVPVEE